MTKLIKNTLLLTATIKPHKDVIISVNNFHDRYNQYIKNIIRYLVNSDFDSIIFCDNSNFDIPIKNELLNLAKFLDKKLEFLKFQWNNEETVKRGRWFGENEIIEYAINNSKLLKNSTFYKCTWRYYCTNVNKILKHTHKHDNYFCRQMPWARNDFCFDKVHTAFYKVSINFFNNYLLWAWYDVNDSLWKNLEAVYYARFKQCKNEIFHLPYYPEYIWVAGSWWQNLKKWYILTYVLRFLHTIGFNKI